MDDMKTCGVGIKFPAKMLVELDAYASDRSVSRAEIVRTCVAIGLPLLKLGVAVNMRRFLASQEYCQLSLSMMVEREYPGDHEQLLDMAFRNVDEFHA